MEIKIKSQFSNILNDEFNIEKVGDFHRHNYRCNHAIGSLDDYN